MRQSLFAAAMLLAALAAHAPASAADVTGAPTTATATARLTGVASWYGRPYHGRHTANGERFDRNAMTAAHPSLPFQSLVRVVDRATGRAVVVRINDRGPGYDRAIDLSEAAARELGMHARGLAQVDIHMVTARSD
jgi:rare lipoprotein A